MVILLMVSVPIDPIPITLGVVTAVSRITKSSELVPLLEPSIVTLLAPLKRIIVPVLLAALASVAAPNDCPPNSVSPAACGLINKLYEVPQAAAILFNPIVPGS